MFEGAIYVFDILGIGLCRYDSLLPFPVGAAFLF